MKIRLSFTEMGTNFMLGAYVAPAPWSACLCLTALGGMMQQGINDTKTSED